MKSLLPVVFLAVTATCCAETPEQTATRYFDALAKSDKDALMKLVFEPSATRIGKSILAASPTFHRKGNTDFFEMIFDRAPTPAEISSMTPFEAFAEYMCDPPSEESGDATKRTILGVVHEGDQLAHVVYSVDGIPNLGEKDRDVLTCISHNGQWRVVVSFQVWEAYMNYMLRPAMARLSDGEAEKPDGREPE